MKKILIAISVIAITATATAQDSITVTPGKSVTVTTTPCDQVAINKPLPKVSQKKQRVYSGGISDRRLFYNPSKITVGEVGQLADIFARYQSQTAYHANFFQQISMEQNYGISPIYPEGMVVFYGKVPDAIRHPLVSAPQNDTLTRDGLLILFAVLVLGSIAYLIYQNSRPHTAPAAPVENTTPVRTPPAVPSHETLNKGDVLEVNENGGYKFTKG